MGVGIYLEGSYGKPGFLRRPPEAEAWLEEVREWLQRREGDQLLYAEVARPEPKGQWALFAGLHPAEEDFELRCERAGRVIASVRTNGAGPGYHQHVCGLLHPMESAFDVRWDPPNERKGTGDESGYFQSGDRAALERTMLNWLNQVLVQILEMQEKGYDAIALSMPLTDVTFLTPAALLTSAGPRDLHWLRKSATDLLSGIDVLSWWNEARDARYYRDRALVHMWSEIRWRPALTDDEAAVQRRTLALLDRAADLDPTLPLPVAEREELRAYLSAAEPPVRGDIGYYRGMLRCTLAGGWSVEIPGSLVQQVDEEGNWSAWDEQRNVYVSSLGVEGRNRKPGAAELLESAREEIPKVNVLTMDEPPRLGVAAFHECPDPESHRYLLTGRVAVPGSIAVCTIEFSDPALRPCAEAIWRSIRNSEEADDE